MKQALIALAIATALVWGGWLVVVPAEMIKQRSEDSLRRGELSAELAGF